MKPGALVEGDGMLLGRELQLLVLPGGLRDEVPEHGFANSSAPEFGQNGHAPYMAGFVQGGEQPGHTRGGVVREHREKMIGNLVGIVPFQLRRNLLFLNKYFLAYLANMARRKLPAVFSNTDGHSITRNTQNPDYKALSANRAEQGRRQTVPVHSCQYAIRHTAKAPPGERLL